MEFYKTKLGAELGMMMRFSENPDGCGGAPLPENWGNKIMHCDFTIGSSVLMGSDGMEECKPASGHCLSLTMPTEAEAIRVFTALAEGGSVFMPLGKTFFSPCFGMVSDCFGISWMVTTPEVA